MRRFGDGRLILDDGVGFGVKVAGLLELALWPDAAREYVRGLHRLLRSAA